MTPLRDKAIAAAARDLCPREDVCAYCLQSAEMAVDALLAAGLLHDPTATIDAAPCGATDSGAPVVGAPRTATSSGPCFGATWKPAPRDDEARIERAALAALDVATAAEGEWRFGVNHDRRNLREAIVDALVAAGLIRPAHDDAAYVAMREEFIRIIDDADSCIHAQPSKESLATTLVRAARSALAAAEERDDA